MILMKTMPMTATNVAIITGAFTSFCGSGGIGHDLLADVQSALALQLGQILADRVTIGCHIIGQWPYNDQTEEYITLGLAQIANDKYIKYYPYMKVLNDEFSPIVGRVTSHDSYADRSSGNGSRTNTRARAKNEATSGSSSGASRSASEDSPISSASIDSAPANASVWGMSNPTMKSGEQFDNASSATTNETINESDSESTTNSGNGSGTKDHYTDDPNNLIKVLRFNVDELNITRIAYMIANSLTEEYHTIY